MSSIIDTANEAALTEDVLKIISDYLDVPLAELAPERSLEELGADSLDFLEIVFEIEEKFGIDLGGQAAALREKLHCVGDVIRETSALVAEKQIKPQA